MKPVGGMGADVQTSTTPKTPCQSGYYCPNATVMLPCPADHFCKWWTQTPKAGVPASVVPECEMVACLFLSLFLKVDDPNGLLPCRAARGWPSALRAVRAQTSVGAASWPSSSSWACCGWPTSPSLHTLGAYPTHPMSEPVQQLPGPSGRCCSAVPHRHGGSEGSD